MNQQAYEAGKAAYRGGDMSTAVAQLSLAKAPGEVSGAVDHLLGNCLMKMGRYAEAAAAYADALRDGSYGSAGALACNRGRALLAAGQPQEAIASLTMATRDSSYPTPYKAYMALGNAELKVNNVREAGVAFRNAAIDDANPDPSVALRSLGGCFMQMGRAVDAVEAYRTALDFSTPLANQAAIYAELGMAYVAANRMAEAVDAFAHATSDGAYQLTPEQLAASGAAQRAVSAISQGAPSETDALLSAAGYGGAGYDPLDPMGESGEFMPSPEDTGFFSVNEKEIEEQARADRKVKRKHHHTGLKAFIVVMLLLVVVGGGLAYAYWQGLGFPSQESVITELFSTNAAGGDISPYLAGSVSSDARAQIEGILPDASTGVTIDGLDRSMSTSTALVTSLLASGGEQSYDVSLVRDGVGWKVSDVAIRYFAQGDGATTLYTEPEQQEGEAAPVPEDATVAAEGTLPAEGEGSPESEG